MTYASAIIASMWVSMALAYAVSLVAEDHHCQEAQRQALAFVDATFKPCMIISVLFIILCTLVDISGEYVAPLHP